MTIITEVTQVTVEEGDTEILIQTIPDETIPGSYVTSHGSLTGLTDNDHPQYLLRSEAVITASEVKTLYESNADTNVFLDSEKTKLGTIESGATQDQTAAEIKGLLSITGDVVDTTGVQTLTNKIITDLNNDIHANLLHAEVRNQTGSTLYKGQAVAVQSYIGGELVERVELANNTTIPANYIIEEDIPNGTNGSAILAGILDGIDTTGDAVNNFCADTAGWNVKDILYVNGAGKLTKVPPTTGYVQPIAMVLRAHATEGALHILAADPRNVSTGSTYGEVLTARGDTSGYGELVWKDITGIYLPDSGVALPSVAAFKTVGGFNIDERTYAVNDASAWKFHIPHDWAEGTDMYIHVHWGHNGTAITGSCTWGFSATFAPRTVASGGGDAFIYDCSNSITTGSLIIDNFPRYSHVVEEVQLTDTLSGTPSSTLIDTGAITVDGVLIVHIQLTAPAPTITGSTTANTPFLFFVDLHYQANLIGTKSRTPDFNA